MHDSAYPYYYWNVCSQGLRCYPFAISLERHVTRGSTFNDLSNRVYVPNKRENLNLHDFDMVTVIN